MKKTIFITCILTVLFIQSISAQELGDLYTQRGFTMSMPRGWQTADVGVGYLQINGPQSGVFPPNIAFRDEDYSGPVSDYIDMMVGAFPRHISNFRLLERSTFRTNSGVSGEFIIYQGTMGTGSVRQKMYVFPNRRGNAIMVITCTSPINANERYDAIFDAAVRTFSWTR